MTEAKAAGYEVVEKSPAEVGQRLETAEKLSDEDRRTITDIARRALAPFQPKPVVSTETKAKTATTLGKP
mgnify:CR=1 FL=1